MRLRDRLCIRSKAVVHVQELAGAQRGDVHRNPLENAEVIIEYDFYLAGTSMAGTQNSGIV